jgi:hypothetical protein
MYITKQKALKIPLDFITYQGKEEIKAPVDSGAMDNFIDSHMVDKLNLGMCKIPRPRQIYNVDGT